MQIRCRVSQSETRAWCATPRHRRRPFGPIDRLASLVSSTGGYANAQRVSDKTETKTDRDRPHSSTTTSHRRHATTANRILKLTGHYVAASDRFSKIITLSVTSESSKQENYRRNLLSASTRSDVGCVVYCVTVVSPLLG